jgi:hypothetical protein
MRWEASDPQRYLPNSRHLMLLLDSQLTQYVESVLMHDSDDGRLRSIVRDLVLHNSVWRAEFQSISRLREIIIHSSLEGLGRTPRARSRLRCA